jgi:hypothetical protein
MPCLCANFTRCSRARCSSFASVGEVIAFGCTVVSTITRVKSAGLAAPLRVARCKLSCSRATSFSSPRLTFPSGYARWNLWSASPMGWRQRVIEDRSNGSAWQKKS